MKILVVEDERRAADYLRQGLAESGYVVEVALNGTDGLHAAMNGDHDLVVLDVMLPGLDGFAVLSALRTAKQTPVLMLTARAQVNDKVRGFDLGADDYLVKPFQFPELLARVRALLKRGRPVVSDPVQRVADLEIDPLKHRATRGGQRIDLSAKEFALLALLVQLRAGCGPAVAAHRARRALPRHRRHSSAGSSRAGGRAVRPARGPRR
jgi:two-component system copper resistance phosphate regulon response regulator CusR